MLPVHARVRTGQEHRLIARRGRRASAGPLAVSLVVGRSGALGGTAAAARAGVVVPKAVGPAVVRNRVRRQLRHLLAPRLPALPAGSALVVRVVPGQGSAERLRSEQLGGWLDEALARSARGAR